MPLVFYFLLLLWLGRSLSNANTDADALLAIKQQLGSTNPKLTSWTGSDPCSPSSWQGVSCTSGRVTSLNLTEMQLSGTFPMEFGNLTNLQVLDVQNNSIAGPLPDSFSNLASLRVLNLSVNPINGSLPKPIMSLKGLVELRLDACNLTGTIPADVSNLSKLQVLYLSQNNITGPVLSTLAELLPQLVELSLWKNMLYSELPSSIGRLKNLKLLNLHDCGVQGELPDAWGSLTNIEILYLYKNNLSGVIPSSWNQMKRLQKLFLYSNQLRGNFPVWLADLLKPEDIQLNCNFLSGPRPGTNFPRNSYKGNCFDEDKEDGFRDHNRQCQDVLGCRDFFKIFPPPPASSPAPSPSLAPDKKKTSTGAIAGAVAGGISLAILLLVGAVSLKKCRKRELYNGTEDSNVGQDMSVPLKNWEMPEGIEMFSFNYISKATSGFSKEHEIGSGGFGRVYRATLDDGRVVAIKQASETTKQGNSEFLNEILLLSRLHHRHLVKLLGFCQTVKHQILVYEYMENGNLHERLFRAKSAQGIHWNKRLEIAVGVAEGLNYLHSFAEPPVIHRDLKPSNILLDANFVAKISDFGISKVSPEFDTHVSTRPAGTAGYLDPEYFLRRQLTTASDVYSFGVVLLELVTGQKAIDHKRPEGINLVEWVRLRFKDGNIDSIIDSRFQGDYPQEQYAVLTATALKCCSFEKAERPSIKTVLHTLTSLVHDNGMTTPGISEVYMDEDADEVPLPTMTTTTMTTTESLSGFLSTQTSIGSDRLSLETR